MDWLNYRHLPYFWVVASEGSVTAGGPMIFRGQALCG